MAETAKEPAKRPAAPGALALVQDFVNTYDAEDGADHLPSAEDLRAWLTTRGLLPDGDALSGADLRRAIEVREALRALLLANNGEALDPQAIATLNLAARHAGLVVRFSEDGSCALEPDVAGVEGALGRLLAIVHEAMLQGMWSRLKACRSDDCLWAFYDHSKNRSGAWCSMAVCGNRSKARAYRRRHAGPSGGERREDVV